MAKTLVVEELRRRRCSGLVKTPTLTTDHPCPARVTVRRRDCACAWTLAYTAGGLARREPLTPKVPLSSSALARGLPKVPLAPASRTLQPESCILDQCIQNPILSPSSGDEPDDVFRQLRLLSAYNTRFIQFPRLWRAGNFSRFTVSRRVL